MALELQGELERFFRYDACANLLWLEALSELGWPEPDTTVMKHALGASEIWRIRVEGTSPTSPPPIALTTEHVEGSRDGWIELLHTTPLDQVIQYRKLNGDAGAMSFADIARHVVNHGTYHRGEMRGLCRARGEERFPETDFAGFALLPNGY